MRSERRPGRVGASFVSLIFAAFAFAGTARSATTITVSSVVKVPNVKRFGINTGFTNEFDSGQITKQLLFQNPGFDRNIVAGVGD